MLKKYESQNSPMEYMKCVFAICFNIIVKGLTSLFPIRKKFNWGNY